MKIKKWRFVCVCLMMFTGPGRSANCWSKPAKRHHLFKIPDWLKKTNVLLKPSATWSQCRHHTPLSMENGESKSERLSIATLDTSRCWFPGLWNSSRFNYFTWSPTKLDWNLTLIKSLKHSSVPQLSHRYPHVTYLGAVHKWRHHFWGVSRPLLPIVIMSSFGYPPCKRKWWEESICHKTAYPGRWWIFFQLSCSFYA